VPLQARPCHLRAKYGNLVANTVYIRRGSSTAIATPDQIADMGRHITPYPEFVIQADAKVRSAQYFLEMCLEIWIENRGKATAYDLQINVERDSRKCDLSVDHSVWGQKMAAYPKPAFQTPNPLHPQDKIRFAICPLGTIESEDGKHRSLRPGEWNAGNGPANYNGGDFSMLLRIFARDRSPCDFKIEFSEKELRWSRSQVFNGTPLR
jgi:hypothetical protein